MKYLITGGAGFIGSHLAERLILRGDQVLVLDNLSTGSLSNLTAINSKATFISGDILNEDLVSELIEECDYVVHLAASLGVLNIVTKPLESLLVNLRGSEIVIALASKFNKPILIASTSEIYGKNTKAFLSEEDDRIIGHPLKSRWSYSEAKAVDESLAFFYFQERGLEARIVRFFNTVGPRQVGHYGMVLPRFVSAALQNEPLNVYGSGEQIRCFCHVSDAVKALILVMDSDKSIGQVFNIGNSEQISIMDLAKRVVALTESESVIERVAYELAYPDGFEDMQRRVPDLTKINRILGWQPEVTLDQIIRDIAAFHGS
jgi:UDP-glucose 4-epimerase